MSHLHESREITEENEGNNSNFADLLISGSVRDASASGSIRTSAVTRNLLTQERGRWL